ncbi:hypothetical protein [Sphingobium nicotianae]|uniref:Uncharacterized protein n=1 Tax=Sphingobium nicotianae TaxID=2782607 RepID=A0A9X1IQI8_9SPHN|nr:hypothetical protein [Sphingobium nicotianae]MBT2186661.1 hypothetical protein [Sphingobium nicotianae]
MIEPSHAFPVRRILFAAVLTTLCASLMMPLLIVLPPALFHGDLRTILGFSIFSLVFGLYGPFLAPVSASSALACAVALISGLVVLERRQPMTRRRLVWAVAGLLPGAIVGPLAGWEFGTAKLVIDFAGTVAPIWWLAIAGMTTGALSSLIALSLMDF